MARAVIHAAPVANLLARAVNADRTLADRLAALDQLLERPALLKSNPRLEDDLTRPTREQWGLVREVEATLLRALEVQGPCRGEAVAWRAEGGEIRRSLPWTDADPTRRDAR